MGQTQDADWNSAAADLERITETMLDYAERLARAGQGAGRELGDLDAIEAMLIDRMVAEPERCRRVLAWCFVVALKRVMGGG